VRLTHEQIKRLIGPYAVKELPAQAVPGVRAHLDECEECRSEAEAVSILVARLNSTEAVEPPPGLTTRVVARLPRTRRIAPVRVVIVSLATSVLVAAGTAIWALNEVGDAEAVAERADDRVERYRIALVAMMGSDEGVSLKGSTNAAARVMDTTDGPVLVAVGLPTLPEGRTYQLWLGDTDSVVSAALFQASADVSIVEIPLPVDRFDRALVTEEPAGGSAQPTSDPIVISQT